MTIRLFPEISSRIQDDVNQDNDFFHGTTFIDRLNKRSIMTEIPLKVKRNTRITKKEHESKRRLFIFVA